MGTIILSAFVAHTAWHWTTERWATLRQFSWPALTASDLSAAIRWLMALVALAALIWGIAVARRRSQHGPTAHHEDHQAHKDHKVTG